VSTFISFLLDKRFVPAVQAKYFQIWLGYKSHRCRALLAWGTHKTEKCLSRPFKSGSGEENYLYFVLNAVVTQVGPTR
jgi:hypothetical protein